MAKTKTKSPHIYGHRGARGLMPECTLSGYQTALDIGVDAIDLDIQMTKDYVIVAYHDYVLNPCLTKNKYGDFIQEKNILIKDLGFRQLQTYRVGELRSDSPYAKLFPQQKSIPDVQIPSLKQVIQLLKKQGSPSIVLQIEIKTSPLHPEYTHSIKIITQQLATLLQNEDIIERCEIQAFDYRCLLALQKINPLIKTAYLTSANISQAMLSDSPELAGLWSAGYLLKDYNRSTPQMVQELGGSIWGPQDIELTQALVDEAHKHQLKVVPWCCPEKARTDFDEDTMRKLIVYGVDGIITERPDLLQTLLNTNTNSQ
jgi:glycerophosphoryl diester phosphodiesterase